MRNKVKFVGVLFFLYAILMSIERFFIEFIRVNPRYELMGGQLSQAHIISIGIFITGIVGMVYWYRRGEELPKNA